jgi:hypothetical protein
MSELGVRRAKTALSSGCKPHPAIAPAGSNRSSRGGNEVAEAFDYPTARLRTEFKLVGLVSLIPSLQAAGARS